MLRPSRLLVAVAAAIAAAGCQGPLHYTGTEHYSVVQGFETRRPPDVAVLAVSGQLPEEAATALREALRARLLDLKYAPVRLQEVDRRPGDYRPGGSNAVLEVNVSKWDDFGLYGDGTVVLTAEVRLFGGGSMDVLYRGRLEDVPVQASFVASTVEDRPTTLSQAATEAAGRLLHRLPVKGDG